VNDSRRRGTVADRAAGEVGVQFTIDVQKGPGGTLLGEVSEAGSDRSMSFWGIAELVGLLEAPLLRDEASSTKGATEES
jgi:hypothetical protein